MKDPIGEGDPCLRGLRGMLPACFWRSACLVLACALSLNLGARENGPTSDEFLEKLEWRGVMALPGETRFSLHDGDGRGFWIGMDEVRSGIEVAHYDPDENELTLRHGEATKEFVMSSSTVAAMDDEPAPAPPPLVVVGEGESDEAEGEEESVEEAEPIDDESREHLAGLWEQAMEESLNIREIDQGLQAIRRQREGLAEAMSETRSDDPEYDELAAIERRLRQEQKRLTEGALNELQKTESFSGEGGRELNGGIRAGFLSQLASPSAEVYDPAELAEGVEPDDSAN